MKNNAKKTLKFVSLALAVLGIIGIIMMLVIPHGGTYSAKVKEGEKEITTIYKLKDGKIYNSLKTDDKYTYEDVELGEYVINDGKISYKAGLVSIELGEINSFKIVTKIGEKELTCKMTQIFFVIACVMTVLGVAGTVYSVVSSKKKKK